MVTYRLIGKGTTDSNGVAHMTKATSDGGSTWTDTTGYTGVGAGEIDVVASTDNPMSASSCQSEPYIVWDTFTYDGGTTGTANDIWDTYQCTLNRDGEYSEVTETTEYGFIRTKQANSIPKNCTIEFDYFNVDGALNRGVMQLQTTANAYITLITLGYLGNLPVGAWHHIKIKIDGGVMTVTNNTNTTVYTANLTIATDNILFLFTTNNETTKFRFKNFKAYGV